MAAEALEEEGGVKRTARDFALIGRVFAEIGAGRMTEAFISDGGSFTDGFVTGGGHITINPVHQTVDTIIHECLHRMNPAWSERYVRRTTSYLRRRMSDDEIVALHDEYTKRAKKRKSPVRLDE